MSRIRSIHPGFFTDEDLVVVSMAARMLFLGLGVEADDKGIFEWKPLTIKMRVFPADNVDVATLLEELTGTGAICRYEVNGKSYGAIRNFRKFQKPKTPNDIHPASPEILVFVGLPSETASDEVTAFPPKGETFPPKGEKSFQMEDGGGKRESKRRNPPAPTGGDLPDWIPADEWGGYERMRKTIRKPLTPDARKLAFNELAKLKSAGNDPAAVLNQSILNSWQGLFELKAKAPNKPRSAVPV